MRGARQVERVIVVRIAAQAKAAAAGVTEQFDPVAQRTEDGRRIAGFVPLRRPEGQDLIAVQTPERRGVEARSSRWARWYSA